MPLQDRGGQLFSCSGQLTEQADICCDETTCCTTHEITSISFLSASSGSNCCWDFVGTYLPDLGISGGCEYNFIENFPEPDNPCVNLDVDDPPPPPADLCFTRTASGNTYRFFIRSIEIEARLENGDMVGDAKIDVQIELTFYVYRFVPGSPGCAGIISSQGAGVVGVALDSCATATVDFVTTFTGSNDPDGNSIHPACGTAETGITVQIVIAPL